MLCEDKDCIFKFKTYGKPGSGVKPNVCRLNVHIAAYVINEYNCTTCELGCAETDLTENEINKALKTIRQMTWEGKNGEM